MRCERLVSRSKSLDLTAVDLNPTEELLSRNYGSTLGYM